MGDLRGHSPRLPIRPNVTASISGRGPVLAKEITGIELIRSPGRYRGRHPAGSGQGQGKRAPSKPANIACQESTPTSERCMALFEPMGDTDAIARVRGATAPVRHNERRDQQHYHVTTGARR